MCSLTLTQLSPIPRISAKHSKRVRWGPVAEWLCGGLQILIRRFDSGPDLHLLFIFTNISPLENRRERRKIIEMKICRRSEITQSLPNSQENTDYKNHGHKCNDPLYYPMIKRCARLGDL